MSKSPDPDTPQGRAATPSAVPPRTSPPDVGPVPRNELETSLRDALRTIRHLGDELTELRRGPDHARLRGYLAETFFDGATAEDVSAPGDDPVFSPQRAAELLAADLEIVGTATDGGMLLRFRDGSGRRQEERRASLRWPACDQDAAEREALGAADLPH